MRLLVGRERERDVMQHALRIPYHHYSKCLNLQKLIMTSLLYVVNYYGIKLDLKVITKKFHVNFQSYLGRSSRMATVRKQWPECCSVCNPGKASSATPPPEQSAGKLSCQRVRQAGKLSCLRVRQAVTVVRDGLFKCNIITNCRLLGLDTV
jgi:hypothetical protein